VLPVAALFFVAGSARFQEKQLFKGWANTSFTELFPE